MRWPPCFVAVLSGATLAHSYRNPVSIRWGGLVAKGGFLAPASSDLRIAGPPPRLTISDHPGRTSAHDIAYFRVNSDQTISWDATGWCVEAVGDAHGVSVQLNHCKGGPLQLWNCLPYGNGRNNLIQLKGSTKCISIAAEAGSINAPIQLQECKTDEMQSWRFEDKTPPPTQTDSYIFFANALAVLAMLSFLAWFSWRRQFQTKGRVVAVGQEKAPSILDDGGISMATPLGTGDWNVLAQGRVSAVLTISPISAESGMASTQGFPKRGQSSSAVCMNGASDKVGASMPTTFTHDCEPTQRRRISTRMQIPQQIDLANSEIASRMIAPKAWRSRGWHGIREIEGRNRNTAKHKEELSTSRSMGFQGVAAAVSVNRPTQSWQVSRQALAMGRTCPFESDELIYAAQQVLSASECDMLRNEADDLLSTGAQYVYTLADTVREVAVHQLPVALDWLNTQGLPRLASIAAHCFPNVVSDPTELWVYDALIIKYDADAFELPQTPMHRDSSMITFVIPLVAEHEYTGGGTYIEAIDQSITIAQGSALIHASRLRHSGFPLTSGKRWVLAVFLNPTHMPHAEHGRRFHERALWILQTLRGEIVGPPIAEKEREQLEDEMRECFAFAVEETDGEDYAIFVNYARHALKEGKLDEALQFLQRAEELKPGDADIATNKDLVLRAQLHGCDADIATNKELVFSQFRGR